MNSEAEKAIDERVVRETPYLDGDGRVLNCVGPPPDEVVVPILGSVQETVWWLKDWLAENRKGLRVLDAKEVVRRCGKRWRSRKGEK